MSYFLPQRIPRQVKLQDHILAEDEVARSVLTIDEDQEAGTNISEEDGDTMLREEVAIVSLELLDL